MEKALKEAKAYVKSLSTKEELKNLLDSLVISTRDREVIERLYIECKSVDLTAYELSYSSVTVKRVNREFLIKVNYIMEK